MTASRSANTRNLALLLAPAHAGDGVTQATAALRRPVANHPVLELRAGVDARPGGPHDGPTRPYLCGEVTPLKRLGVEACGNGAGVIQDEQLSDFAHFRARVTAVQQQAGRFDLDVIGGVGWAEVQRGQDAAGAPGRLARLLLLGVAPLCVELLLLVALLLLQQVSEPAHGAVPPQPRIEDPPPRQRTSARSAATAAAAGTNSLGSIRIYQYEICPFCNKVKALLDL